MSTIEKRIEALERAPARIADQTPPDFSGRSIDELRKKFEEVLSRPRPVASPEDQILIFKATLERMRVNWELRHGR